MTGQLTLGEVLKSAGMARADEAEPSEWKARADQAIAHLASLGRPFSAEDVRAICGDPEHVNAIGSRFSVAARKGVIRPFGFEEAERPSRHRAVLRIWVGATETPREQGTFPNICGALPSTPRKGYCILLPRHPGPHDSLYGFTYETSSRGYIQNERFPL